ncbi:MAG: hypothetical protein ICV66_00260 [Chitinophagaceae bacterium]|nr:hypothetical protein [Chitinophagaceae bacterium]
MTNKLQNKLFNYEVEPPPSAWHSIEAALDDNAVSLSEKLYEFEEQPNPQVWEKINAALGEGNSKKGQVIPFYKLYGRPLKYGGSIAIFVVIAMVVSLFINKRAESDEVVPPVKNYINSPVKQPADSQKIKVVPYQQKNK